MGPSGSEHQSSSAQPRLLQLIAFLSILSNLLSSAMSQVKYIELKEAILRHLCSALQQGKIPLQATLHPHLHLLSKSGEKTSPHSLQRETSLILQARHRSPRSHAMGRREGSLPRAPKLHLWSGFLIVNYRLINADH